MTPEQLVEKMQKSVLSRAKPHLLRVEIKEMLRVVLQAIQDGEVVTTTEAGAEVRLKPDFQRFMDNKRG